MLKEKDIQLTRFRTKAHRNSSIELLRIISMFAILMCHFASHGDFSFDAGSLTLPQSWWLFIETGGNFGVNVFVLISGYFLVKSKDPLFNIKRILKLWGQVFFYSVIILIIFNAAGLCTFSADSIKRAVFPISFEVWWFASTYFFLYIIHPFINMLLQKLDKSSYQKLLAMLLICWCVLPTFTLLMYQSNRLIWFVTLYCVAGYIRIYGLNRKIPARTYFIFWIFFSLLRYFSGIVITLLGTKTPALLDDNLFFYRQQSIFTFLSALNAFIFFEKTDIGYNKYINLIASATFGVYLIHDNEIIRPFLWKTVFKNSLYQDSAILIPYSIGVAVLVFAVCTVIDLLRQTTVERLFLIYVNLYADRILKPFIRMGKSFKKFFL